MINLINAFFRYRLNVSILMFFLCLAFFSQDINQQTVLIAICFSILISAIYFFNKYTDTIEDNINLRAFPLMEGDRQAILIFSGLFFIIPLPYLFYLNLSIAYFYICVPAFFGILYSQKINLFGKKFRFKDIPFLKNFASAALIWAPIPTFLPNLYYEYNPNIWTLHTYVVIFSMVYVVEMIWDIRDIEGDLEANIKTIPNQFGVRVTKVIACALCLFCLILSFLPPTSSIIFKITYVIMVGLIIVINRNSNAYMFQSLVILWIIANFIFLLWS